MIYKNGRIWQALSWPWVSLRDNRWVTKGAFVYRPRESVESRIQVEAFVYAPLKMVDYTFQFTSSFSGIQWSLVESTTPGGDKRMHPKTSVYHMVVRNYSALAHLLANDGNFNLRRALLTRNLHNKINPVAHAPVLQLRNEQ